MAELSSTSTIRHLHDALRDQLPSRDIALILAVLIYLRWADFQEAELEAMAAFDDITYEPVLPASLHWRTWHQLRPDELSHVLTERLPVALQQLSNTRHNPLATHLHRLAGPMKIFGKLSPFSLGDLTHLLAALPFETPTDRRQLLIAFDDFLEAAQDKYAGEFKTPRHVARLMVELAAPAAGERVYDPCFGSAGLLTAAFYYALRSAEQKSTRYGGANLTISGIEINESTYIIGLTRLALAGIDDPQLELGNSLERIPPNNPQKDGFDVVIANPPWGWTAKIDPYGLHHFPIMTKDSVGLFIQHALAQLRPNGRAVLAVPQGILFRGGADRRLREWLISQHTVEAVISLPETTFLPLTAIKSSILMLRRGGTTKHIRMVDAESFFERGKGRQPAIISDSQVRELVKKTRAPDPSDCCWDVDVSMLAEREFDFTPQRRNQSGLTVILEAIRSETPLVQLKDCCQVMTGRSIRSVDLINEPNGILSFPIHQQHIFKETQAGSNRQDPLSGAEPIPFIRIKDINKGQADKGTSWISAEAAVGVESSWKLRAGDVLLSRSGTIGKIGIVRNGAVGAVAAKGLYILRVDGARLDPHYLAAYLDSADCRAWLNDRATGAVIGHLPKRIIDEIPVPLPPLQVQQRVAAEYRKHGVDVLAYLTQLLTGSERDPIAEWIEKELKVLPTEADKTTNPLDFTLLDQLARHVRQLRNEAVHGSPGENTLIPWLLAFNEAISTLRGVSEIPQGPGLLSVLQESVQGLKWAEASIKGHLPNEGKARKLTGIIAGDLVRGSAALLNNVHLVFSIEVSTLRAGEVQELDLRIQNNSLLPLREIEITFEPEWGYGSFKYLAENAFETIGLRAVAPKAAGPLTLMIHWSVLTLDGRHVDGRREIAFEILPEMIEPINTVVGLGGSPYVCGDPIRPERNDVFFGREDILEQIGRQIVQIGNVVLLEGNRRAGKSSILRHLEGVGPLPGWLGVYCSFQKAKGDEHKTGIATVEVFRLIVEEIAKSVHKHIDKKIALPNGETPPQGERLTIPDRRQFAEASRSSISEGSAFSDSCSYVEFILDELQLYNVQLLLMLDEFDKIQEGIDNGVTSPQVPENIRYLVQTYPHFSVILTGSRRLKRLREEYWSSLYGLGTRFGVTSLSHEAALKLVTEPVNGRLTYSKEAAERAISLTDRQPFLLQCLCNRIFDMAAQLRIRSVTVDFVDRAGDMLAENNEHFASLWDYALLDRRRFILALCHKEAGGPDPLRFGVMLELLSRYGVEVSDETLIADIEFLQELELIELVGGAGSGHYALSIPLMGKWIDRQHDFVVLQKKARMETEDQHD